MGDARLCLWRILKVSMLSLLVVDAGDKHRERID